MIENPSADGAADTPLSIILGPGVILRAFCALFGLELLLTRPSSAPQPPLLVYQGESRLALGYESIGDRRGKAWAKQVQI